MAKGNGPADEMALVGLLIAAVVLFMMPGSVEVGADESRASASSSQPGAQVEDGRAWAEQHGFRCVVIDIPSGDGVVCSDSARVRLIGIDAPESSYGPSAERSRAFLQRLTPPNTEVFVELDAKAEDRWGRVHAYLHLPGEAGMVNEAVLDSGYATHRRWPPNVRHAAELQAAEQRARREARGLWNEAGFLCFVAGQDSEHCAP